MAKIRDYAITISTTTTSSLVCEMPTHATGDVLLAFLNKDSTTGFVFTFIATGSAPLKLSKKKLEA